MKSISFWGKIAQVIGETPPQFCQNVIGNFHIKVDISGIARGCTVFVYKSYKQIM